MFVTIVGIVVEVRLESWVAGASGFWVCFLGLSCCVFLVWLSML